MIWSLATLFTFVILLCVIMFLAYIRIEHVTKYERALQNAWDDLGHCEDFPDKCESQLTSCSLSPTVELTWDPSQYQVKLSRFCLDLIHLVTQAHDTELQEPLRSTEMKLLDVWSLTETSNTLGVLWYHVATDTLVIAFRSTSTPLEIQHDLQMSQVSYGSYEGSLVHAGFHKLVHTFWNESISPQLEQVQPQRVLFTGHSLGGALALLGGVHYSRYYPEIPTHVYSYGAPRVGNQEFAAYVESLPVHIWRVINECDFITQLPPQVTPNFVNLKNGSPWIYQHVGNVYSFNQNWKSWRTNHFLPIYIEYAGEQAC